VVGDEQYTEAQVRVALEKGSFDPELAIDYLLNPPKKQEKKKTTPNLSKNNSSKKLSTKKTRQFTERLQPYPRNMMMEERRIKKETRKLHKRKQKTEMNRLNLLLEILTMTISKLS
jgi:hypothetical protein